MLDAKLLNKIINVLLDRRYYSRIAEWQTISWTAYLELCRKQNYKVDVFRQYANAPETIQICSLDTGAIVGRYCIFNADVTELGAVLGAPGTYEPLFENWTGFIRKFYRVEVSKLKPEYATQKRKTFA